MPSSLFTSDRVRLPRGGDIAAGALAAGALAVAGAGAAGLVDASAGPVLCPFRLVTGVPCPFCGVTRGLAAAGAGDLAAAASASVLALAVLPVAVVVLLVIGRSVRRREPVAWPRPLLFGGLAVVVLLWIARLVIGVR